jgi:hypothetical protein
MRSPLIFEFRFIFVAILGVIVPFGLLLYLLPTQTSVYWAWVIPTARSAMLIGAGYVGAIAYYVLALRNNDWDEVQGGLGGLIVFSAVLLIATMIHWNTFRPYHVVTLVWLIFYYTGPLLVPIAYKLQRAKAGRVLGDGVFVSSGWRTWQRSRAILYFALLIVMLLFAPEISARWPWPIGPLEVRVFAGQIGAVAWVGVLAIENDRAFDQYRLGLVLTFAIGALQLIALFLNAGNYDWSAPFGIVLPLIFAEWVLTPLIMFAMYGRKKAA